MYRLPVAINNYTFFVLLNSRLQLLLFIIIVVRRRVYYQGRIEFKIIL